MDKFYVITNRQKDKDFHITREIQEFIEENGKTCILSEKDCDGYIIPESIPRKMDCGIVLGGDGTLIRAARELKNYNIPLLGINLGTLGYLTEVELQDYKEALTDLFQKEPVIEERMMMTGDISGPDPAGTPTADRLGNTAMNDIVVTRDGALRVVRFNIYVNGELLNNYEADGVIISTPTGTTGYNLSAGGPIVEPTASMFVITPICSHALNTSSIVLSSEDVIEIEIAAGKYDTIEHASVTFDGADTVPLVTGNKVSVRKAEETTKLVKLSRESFMKTMRSKMKGN